MTLNTLIVKIAKSYLFHTNIFKKLIFYYEHFVDYIFKEFKKKKIIR